MFNLKKTFTLLLLLFCGLPLLCQVPKKYDSLAAVYDKLKNDTAKVSRYISLAIELSGIDTARANDYGRKAYQLAEKLNDTKGLGNAYNYFGRMAYFVQDYDKALSFFEKAEDYFEKSGFKRGQASALANIGLISTERGDFKKAIACQEKSLALNIEVGNKLNAANNYVNLGNTYNQTGEWKKALEYFLKAVPVYESLQAWENLATTYYNIGLVHFYQRQYNKAEEYCKLSLKLREEKSFNKMGMGYSYSFLATIYTDLKQYDKAKQCTKKVIELFNETGDQSSMITAYNNYTKILQAADQIDSAIYYEAKVIEIATNIGNKKFMLAAYFQMGELLYSAKRNKEALANYLSCYRLANEIGDRTYVVNALGGMGLVYYALGDYKNAYNALLDGGRKKDSLLVENNANLTSEMEAKFQNEKKQLEIESLEKSKALNEASLHSKEAQLSLQRKGIIAAVAGLLVLGGLSFFTYKNYRRTQKANLIIENQKTVVEFKNEEISHQKYIVESKQKEIIDSINYARRIQHAVLTGEEVWKRISKEHFILFKPRDIVSGDFYWAHVTQNNRAIWALADCTGHGVPGGFMSMLGNSFMNEIIVENRIQNADAVLNRLRDKLIKALEQKGESGQADGMDIALCIWNRVNGTLEFAGANSSAYIVRNAELIELKGDKMPVGLHTGQMTAFTSKTVTVQANDMIYLCTDGYADQFGGPKGKKFNSKQLRELFKTIAGLDASAQQQTMTDTFEKWKARQDQVDDVSVIGVRV